MITQNANSEIIFLCQEILEYMKLSARNIYGKVKLSPQQHFSIAVNIVNLFTLQTIF